MSISSHRNNDLCSKVKSFIVKDSTTKEMVIFAEKFGKENHHKVTTSQIRNAYGSMKKLEMSGWGSQTQRELILLKPRLAYAADRHKRLEKLKNILHSAIDAVSDEASFRRFCQFLEAIVAYHKAAGGK